MPGPARWSFLLATGAALLLVAGSASAQRGGRPVPPPDPPTTETPPARSPVPKPADSKGAAPGDGKTFSFEYQDVLEIIQRGESRAALAFYERSAAEFERQGALANAAQAHLAAAATSGRLGSFQKCIRSGLRATELIRGMPQAPATNRQGIQALSEAANCYAQVSDLAEARRRYGEARDFAQGMGRGSALAVAVLSGSIGRVAFRQGDHEAALENTAQAVQGFEAVLSSSDAVMGREQARMMAYAKEAARRNLARALALLGDVHLARKNPAEAEAAYNKALGHSRLVGLAGIEGEIRMSLARLALSRKDARQALRQFQEALALATKANLVPLQMRSHEGLARAHAAQGHPDKALEAVHQALQLVESLRGDLQETGLRSGFLEDKQGIYQLAVELSLGAGRTAEAFGYAESSRARAFLDMLGNQTTLSKGKTRALVEEEVKLRAQLAAARTQAEETGDSKDDRGARRAVEAAEHAYRAFLDRVRKESLEQASLMSVEPVTIQEIQGLLPEGTTLLEYLVADEEVVVWVIDRAQTKVVRLPGRRAELVTAVREFRSGIATLLPLEQLEPRARALYDRLLARVRPEIHGERLLIVPHDALHYLPFAALRTPVGHWLIEDYAMVTLPSASVLKYLKGKGAGASDRVLAIGNPDLGAGLELRWAEREARMVGQRYPAASVLVRGEATEAKAKALSPQAGLIHFAMHGELNEGDPLGSALLLMPGGGEDGRLEVRELFGLELNARLVVLSACETGLGKLSRGDELVGLQRAFLYAGTPAVVTTLWKVDDRASFELIRSFYAELPARGASGALREAQRAAITRFPHPFAWAAFSVTGLPQ